VAGDLPKAEELARAALQDEPSLPQLSKNSVTSRIAARATTRRGACTSRAIELAPELGDDVYFKLGNIAYKRNDPGQANDLWRRALELNPSTNGESESDTLSSCRDCRGRPPRMRSSR